MFRASHKHLFKKTLFSSSFSTHVKRKSKKNNNNKEAVPTISNYLPEEILQEIFLRLPGISLLRFRCVSKSFCTLIDTISFHNKHPELSNMINYTSIMFYEYERERIFTVDYNYVCSLLLLSTSSSTMCEFVNEMKFPTILQGCGLVFLSSCDGLVCMIRASATFRRDSEYYIWNPSTKVYKNIPMPREVKGDDIRGYGFCYDYMTEDYKLVRVVADSKCSSVDVYTLGLNSWKIILGIPYSLYYNPSRYSKEYHEGVLLNGALHWLARTIGKDSAATLICFDIAHERFEEVALPDVPMPYPEEPLEQDKFYIDVNVLGGCLCLVYHVHNVRVDVWTMQDYGVQESWTKSFSITLEKITSSQDLDLIWSFKNNVTLWDIDGGFILYDPKNKLFRELTLDSPYDDRLTIARNYVVSSVLL